jgi:hypothetical protein
VVGASDIDQHSEVGEPVDDSTGVWRLGVELFDDAALAAFLDLFDGLPEPSASAW